MLEVGMRARRRVYRRLLPFLFVLCLIAFIDRGNVGYAALRMSADLGFSDAVLGFGGGVFFIGYLLLEIPGTLIVERYSARKWFARIMVSWGITTVLTAFIDTPREFYAARFFLGVAEAGFFPGIVVYLTHWFCNADGARARGIFISAIPLSYATGSPIASALFHVRWFGLAGWRWLFILEGVPAVTLGVIAWFFLTDWPREAKWLPVDEKAWLENTLAKERERKRFTRHYTALQAMRDRQVIILTLIYFFGLTGVWSYNFWLPMVIRRASGLSDSASALLAGVPFVLAALAMHVVSWHSDKSGERRWHTAGPLLWLSIGVFAGVLFVAYPVVSIAALVLAGAMQYGWQASFWAIPTDLLSDSASAAAVGTVNCLGNLSGFFGPVLMGYMSTRGGSFRPGLLMVAASYAIGAALVMMLRREQGVPPLREASRA
jgi:MFS transporter, ACS family, tartrate transporter